MIWSHQKQAHTHIPSWLFFSSLFFHSRSEGNKLVALSATVNIELSALISFFLTFFGSEIVDVIFIVETFLNCMTNARRLLYGVCFCSLFYSLSRITIPSCFSFYLIYWKNVFLLNWISIFMQKNTTRSDSSINYLFCVRSLFLFAYTPLKKTLKRNYSISYERRDIEKKERKKHGNQTEHLGRASNLKSVNQFWLSIVSFWVDHTKQWNENAQNKFCVNLVWFHTMENYA